MRSILHILTQTDDALAQEIITRQRELTQGQVRVVDLTVPEPDYAQLLEAIFTADSVHVW